MYIRLKRNIATIVILSIFFSTIINISSFKTVSADSINNVAEASIEGNKDYGNDYINSIVDENTSKNNENGLIEEKDNILTNEEVNQEGQGDVIDNYSEESLNQDITSNSINEGEEALEDSSIQNTRSLISEGNKIVYQAHVQEIGWQDWVPNGSIAGTTGRTLAIEALNIKLDGLASGVNLKYRSHIKNIGWQDWVSNGEMTGTTGKSLSMEAIEIKLEGNLSYDIMYRVHIRDIGWQEWKNNGEMAGTTGLSKPIEAIEIKIVEHNISELKYQTHVSNEGWTNWSLDGITSGSNTNNQIEAFNLILNKGQESLIKYRSYIRNTGWQAWKSSGEFSGTEGRNLPIEQIEVSLNNAPQGYSIEYRIRTKNFGWNEWKKDGQTASSNGDIITAIQVKVRDTNSMPSISYQTHVRNIGWQNYVANGELAGTIGKALSVEAIKINYMIGNNTSNILYKTHVQDIGWQDWTSNNQISGTIGEAKAIEAIQLKLESPIKGYTLKYRAHIRDLGWQEWKSEGEIAGTTGKSKPIEAIEIKFVEDNLRTIVIDPGHNFGGDDGAYATHYGITYSERDINMQIAMKLKDTLERKGYNIVLTRKPEDIETIEMRQSLKNRVDIANSNDAELFISIHQNSSTVAAVKGVEVYYSSATPISGSAYSNKLSISKQLATNISKSLSTLIATNNRGAKDDDFYVVKNTHMPSILIESGFISNYEEAKKVVNSNTQQKISEVITNEVVNLIK